MVFEPGRAVGPYEIIRVLGSGGMGTVAFVALRPDATATADELIEHCRGQLAKFKVPKDVTFIDALPRNPSGKVLKRELRAG